MAVKISTDLFYCMFCGSICFFFSGSGASDISLVVIVLGVMVRYR